MFLLTVRDKKDEGAYAVRNPNGEKILFMFEEEDDATRYAMQLSIQDEEQEMVVVEVDDELAIKTCRLYNYRYAVVTSNDIVIPPNLNDNI
jgi:hypothetical protein